jgi:hypothetical protein
MKITNFNNKILKELVLKFNYVIIKLRINLYKLIN